MSFKIALLGDTHFDVSNSNEQVYQQQIKFFKNQFFPYLKEHNIKEIIQLGDFFDSKTKVSTYIQYHLMKDFFDILELNNIVMHYFPGNHDLYFKDSKQIYSLCVFEKAYPKNLKVYKTMDLVKFGNESFLMVPWMHEGDQEKMLELMSNFKVDKIFGHFEIKDFSVTKEFQATHGIDKSIFKDKLVYSGHFHLQQKVDNIFYIGTPYQTSWGDYNELKGFYILEEGKEPEFIENTSTSKHIQIEIKSEEKELIVEGFSTGILSANLKKDIDYEIFRNHNVRIFIDKDNAFNKKVIEKIISVCNKYKVKMSCLEKEEGEIGEDGEISKDKTEIYQEFDLTGSIKERLSSEYQIDTFNKVHEETLKQIEE